MLVLVSSHGPLPIFIGNQWKACSEFCPTDCESSTGQYEDTNHVGYFFSQCGCMREGLVGPFKTLEEAQEEAQKSFNETHQIT